MTQAVPHIRAMAPYALAELPAGGAISLAQNESLRPPSPRAIALAQTALSQSQLYPDPDWTELRQALSRVHGIDPEQIVCGTGSLELIAALAQTFAGPGDGVVVPEHAYPFFKTATALSDARLIAAPERGLTVSCEAMACAAQGAKIVFIANPANPTGTRIPTDAPRRLRAALGPEVLLVIDEAYGEFADHLDARCFDMGADGCTVVLRTFSKAYGLAGARVGWGVFPSALAAELRKVLNPNNVSLASQAMALGAVEDQAYMRDTVAQTIAIRDAFRTRLCAAGYDIPETHTNFVLIPFASDHAAAEADAVLKSHGLVLRQQGGAGLPHCLRATVCVASVMDRLADVLCDMAKGETP